MNSSTRSPASFRISPAGLLLATLSIAPLSAAPVGEAEASALLLVGLEPSAKSTRVHLIGTAPFSSAELLVLPARISSTSRLSGTFLWSFTGGWQDGGNLYHLLPGGSFVLVGSTGLGAVPALAWDSASGSLYAATGSAFGADLVRLDPFTGQPSVIGATGVVGIQALAVRPGTGVLYGTTGYMYDGSPGDVLVLDPSTGAATDTGLDFTEAGGSPPACPLSGLSFSVDGTEGYVSTGCGTLGPTPGVVFRFDPATFALVPLGAAGSGGAISGLEVVL
jgi:hypothetical protein